MTIHSHFSQQKGFTLIELLLYISIVGSLLITLSLFFASAGDARIKNQSISEVNQQGALVMEQITQAIRNADAITAPSAGATGTSLSLTVPTAGLSPTIFSLSNSGTSTVMGYNGTGDSTDSSDNNFINAVRFTANATGTISSLNIYMGPIIGPSPNNKGQMAIYSGNSTIPLNLLASSGDTVLTANSWVNFSIPPVNVTSGQIYWLGFNANGTANNQNAYRYRLGASGQSRYIAQTYGSWPASWSGGTVASTEPAMYAQIVTPGSTPAAFQVKEGAANNIPLTSDNVGVSNLTFKNLTRSGTPGVIQVSFTISRVNTSGKNEYDYTKTFTGSASLRWPN